MVSPFWGQKSEIQEPAGLVLRCEGGCPLVFGQSSVPLDLEERHRTSAQLPDGAALAVCLQMPPFIRTQYWIRAPPNGLNLT